LFDEKREPRDRELSVGLLRQRRNLIISSVALFIFVSLGFQLEEVKILGNSAKVSNPKALPIIMLMFHFYFTVRYWQYYLEENHRPSVLSVIKKNIKEFEVKYLTRLVGAALPSFYGYKSINIYFLRYGSIPDSITNSPPIKEPFKTDNQRDIKISYITKKTSVVIQVYSDDFFDLFEGEETKSDLITLRKDKDIGDWKLLPSHLIDDSFRGGFIQNKIEYSLISLFLIKIKSFIKYVFKHSNFSDYELPLILSLGSFLMAGYVVLSQLFESSV
jgi:hypothetical protein